MKHCCVIGGAGFIGSSVVEVLHGCNRRITVIGRSKAPLRPLPDAVRYISGDYGDSAFLEKALQDIDEIIDLAYATVPKTSYDDPVRDILSNLPPAVKLFETACRLSIKKIVIISSGGTIYGKAQEIPIREDHPTNPISPYGITKLALEKYALMFHQLNDLPVVCVRPGNAYGERQQPFVGQGFIATAMANILNRQDIALFGETGTVRDYVYASDIANGIVTALERGTPGSCYNIGSGEGKSNRDVLNMILPMARSQGFDPRIKILPIRDFDVPVNILDSAKLRTETGWQPLISFDEGIKRTWEHYYRTIGLRQ